MAVNGLSVRTILDDIRKKLPQPLDLPWPSAFMDYVESLVLIPDDPKAFLCHDTYGIEAKNHGERFREAVADFLLSLDSTPSLVLEDIRMEAISIGKLANDIWKRIHSRGWVGGHCHQTGASSSLAGIDSEDSTVQDHAPFAEQLIAACSTKRGTTSSTTVQCGEKYDDATLPQQPVASVMAGVDYTTRCTDGGTLIQRGRARRKRWKNLLKQYHPGKKPFSKWRGISTIVGQTGDHWNESFV